MSISGRIGSAAAPALREALAGTADAAGVVVDLTEVDYVSGAGVAALHRAAAANGSFVLCGVTGPVQIALELAGVLSDLRIEPTRAAALARAACGTSPR